MKHFIYGLLLCQAVVAGDAFAQPRLEKNALIILTNRSIMLSNESRTGYDLTQLVHVVEGLGKAGFGLVFASPRGGLTVPDPLSYDEADTVVQKFLAVESVQEALRKTKAVAEVDITRFGVIVCVGGHGALWDFVEIPTVATAASAMHEVGGIVAAIAQGPAVFLQMKNSEGEHFLKLRRVTCATEAEEASADVLYDLPYKLDQSMRYSGAMFFDSGPGEWNVVADDRVITAQNTASTPGFVNAIVEKWNLMFPEGKEKEYRVQPAPPAKRKK